MSADPQQTVLLILQQSLRSILKLLCQRLCGQRPQQAPTGSLPQVTRTVNDRGRTRSQVEGQARKREVREIGVGRQGCVLALSGSHYLPKAHFHTPSGTRGPGREGCCCGRLADAWPRQNLKGNACTHWRLLQPTCAHLGLIHGPSPPLPQQDSEPSGAQRATSGENFQTPHQRTCQSVGISQALDYQPCTAPSGAPAHPSPSTLSHVTHHSRVLFTRARQARLQSNSRPLIGTP